MRATRREILHMTVMSFASIGLPVGAIGQKRNGQPNFVIIFLDDSGWSDFRPFSRTAYATPNVERLARQGCAFHNFYVPQAICSASRASLLTGCYPGRTQVFGAHPPRARGLDPKFATIGEVLQKGGYRTAVFGKWHVGDQPETRPPARGFDESCGLMYSNDMWQFHPENPALTASGSCICRTHTIRWLLPAKTACPASMRARPSRWPFSTWKRIPARPRMFSGDFRKSRKG